MCGRSRCALAPEEVIARARTTTWENRDLYHPAHNVSPGSATPVVHLDKTGHPIIRSMQWGLIPSFTKPTERPDFWRMFNARSESIREKPSFRRLVPSKRCVVLLNGFFEWKKESKIKQPYYIYLVNEKTGEEEPMAMAGLWDVWYRGGPEEQVGEEDERKLQGSHGADQPKEVMYTYTILTTESSKELQWLHDRMPVILKDEKAQHMWLNTTDKSLLDKLHSILGPYSGKNLRWHPVSREMSNPSFQGPEAYQEIHKPSVQNFFLPRSVGKIDNAVKKEEEEDDDDEGVEKKKDTRIRKEKEVQVDPTPNTDEVAPSSPQVPSSATKMAKKTITPTPDSVHKRKLPTSNRSPPSGSMHKKRKKERPAGQPDIASFFSKKKE